MVGLWSEGAKIGVFLQLPWVEVTHEATGTEALWKKPMSSKGWHH